ncbi:4-dihydrotrisporin dehydrogenase [Cokeromyces recurvatus]|uniref:4-dihydrotrisporin dehydrogenase n=1 Tax=Cokeromyces recurvatus TaxID=90255 RepID=UPI002220FBC9|nr:4-dihydrotrisporin dehydrogenase [Cokeromyces recurvatus]KAI7900979.1 4-dihydrotrisporin dehydrogenase [Cokeromyces recurvatus]
MVQTFIVTGASRGLGLEFVKQIAAKGDTVFACARNPTASTGLEALSNKKNVFLVQLDTNSEESIKAAAEEIESKAPEGVDVLINNAGICGTMKLDFETSSKEELTKVFETNVVGMNEVTKAFVPIMRKRGQDKVKKILNMSSILGSVASMQDADGWGFSPAYCISKAASNMLTKMMANKLGKENFVVYASHPGWCQTDMGGHAAPTTTEDSIRGQLAIIDRLTEKDNGKYYDFEGQTLPW